MMYKFRLLVERGSCLAVILSQLGGCAVGPNFVRPAPPDTDRYTHELQSEATIAADGQVQHFMSSNTLIADWWKLFQSTELNAVVNKAIANNPTLQASEASLRQSQDNMRAGYGVFFPQIQSTEQAPADNVLHLCSKAHRHLAKSLISLRLAVPSAMRSTYSEVLAAQ